MSRYGCWGSLRRRRSMFQGRQTFGAGRLCRRSPNGYFCLWGCRGSRRCTGWRRWKATAFGGTSRSFLYTPFWAFLTGFITPSWGRCRRRRGSCCCRCRGSRASRGGTTRLCARAIWRWCSASRVGRSSGGGWGFGRCLSWRINTASYGRRGSFRATRT